MSLNKEYLRLVRDTVPLSLVVSEYTATSVRDEFRGRRFFKRTVCSLKDEGTGRLGKRFSCLCPFHYEQTNSFYVMDSVGRYKCFGCGESGNVFDFVMYMESMTLAEAVRAVAALGGVYPKVPRRRRHTKRKR